MDESSTDAYSLSQSSLEASKSFLGTMEKDDFAGSDIVGSPWQRLSAAMNSVLHLGNGRNIFQNFGNWLGDSERINNGQVEYSFTSHYDDDDVDDLLKTTSEQIDELIARVKKLEDGLDLPSELRNSHEECKDGSIRFKGRLYVDEHVDPRELLKRRQHSIHRLKERIAALEVARAWAVKW